jgi:hypothetical protein
MSRSLPRLAAVVLALGLATPFACKCPSSTTPEAAPFEHKAVRKIDLNKRKALNLRQARRLSPADKLNMRPGGASGATLHDPASPVSGPAAHLPTSAPAAP